MTTVTWVQDSNGNYEISSPEHLKQLMNEGSLYTDAGTPPASYWASNYIQTVDIDLMNDSTDVKPIGTNFSNSFQGSYDGAEYSISNYSYLDPNFNTSNDCQGLVGLFGYFSGGYLKNIRLDGLWTIEGFNQYVGYLSAFSKGAIFNTECNFAPGSFIDTNTAAQNIYCGTITGYSDHSLVGITVKGSVDFRQDAAETSRGGGICGNYQGGSSNMSEVKLLRNLATFPSGIFGTMAGGIFGYSRNISASHSMFLNAMTGDISSSNTSNIYAGGVIGYYLQNDTNGPCEFEYMVNSMTGNITSDGTQFSSFVGGVVGAISGGSNECRYLLNFMSGNVLFTGTANISLGGLIGQVSFSSVDAKVTNSMNAMNGNVENGLFDEVYLNGVLSTSPITNTIVNTNFGLAFTNDTFSTGTPTGLLTSTEFTDLPYFELTGTDVDGRSYDFEFVYGNLSGNTSYSTYTHLVIHRGDISTPYDVSYGLSGTGTTIYLTYVNIQTSTVYPPDGLTGTTTVPGVTFFVPLLDITARAVNIPVVITEVSGATSYKITYEGPTGGEITAIQGVTTLEHNVTGLLPETQYAIRLYADTGSGYALQEETVVETLANVAANYDVSDFTTDGVISLSSVPGSALANIAQVMTEIFNTGDIVNVAVKGNLNTSFINLGDTLSIAEINGVLLPFEETTGAGQDVNVILSDGTTTVAVDYDETVNGITVNGVVYYPGDSFVMDGKKITVVEFS